MKLTTTAGQLRAALRCMTGVIDRRARIPVLSCIKFEDGRLTATDLDMEVCVTLPTLEPQTGAALIDWFGLHALAAHVEPDEALTISEANGKASVSFNGSDYRMATLPVTDFPEVQVAEGVESQTGNLGLVDAIRRVRFCVSREETRYYLNGVVLLEGPEGPVVAATDGHRLAFLPLPHLPEGATGRIINHRTVNWLVRRKAEPETITFSTAGRPAAKFSYPGLMLTAKLIDGTFPDIFRVIPTKASPVFSVDRVKILRVLRRLSAFVTAQAGGMRGVKLSGDDRGLNITLSCHNGSSVHEFMPLAVDAPSEPFEGGYNQHYLIAALSELTGDVATFAVDGGAGHLAGSPALITCENDPLRLVLMPMRV